jgi:rRNA maturation RNase YbeY
VEPARLEIALDHPTRTLDTDRLAHLLMQVIGAEGGTLESLSVVLTDHETVHSLNRDFLAHDYETDVIAFPLGEGTAKEVDGEIYVDLDTAHERCAEFNSTFEQEAARYAVHGLLHLLGYDDATPDGKQTMRDREDAHLTGWGG